MRVLEWFRRRRQRRFYRATLTVYLAVYTFERLPLGERHRVNDWIKRFLEDRFDPQHSFRELELFLSNRGKADYWAVAMKVLGIPPAVPGEDWDLPVMRNWRACRRQVSRLSLDFRPFNAATFEVERYLASKGVDVASIDVRPGSLARRLPT